MGRDDSNTTVGTLKSEVIAMCIRKGWGDNGIQHPQHVATAMMVEMMELLEHFVGIDPAQADAAFTCDKVVEASEEAADVMMYAMQIMHTIGFDVSEGVFSGFSDSCTYISDIRNHLGKCTRSAVQQAMHLAVTSRYMLEAFQWMNEDEVQAIIKGGLCEKRREIGKAFVPVFCEMLHLADCLGFDLTGVIMRKIAIVDQRVYSSEEPVR